jgi:D-alanyl-D-alanine carboxypeptidase
MTNVVVKLLRNIVQIGVTLLLIAAPCGVAFAGPAALDAKFQAELDALRAEYKFPGATAAYVLPNGDAGVVATGLSDVEAGTPMTVRSRMLPASIGKSFVAATVLALANEGVLGLDDPISKWLGDKPWFKRLPNADAITLRQLLTHRSGLPDHVGTEAFVRDVAKRWSEPGNPFPPEALIAYVLDKPALFKPGEGYAYSDTGYILVGLIIEKATGHTYYDEVTRRFLKPLHLTLTGPSSRNMPGLAAGYMPKENPFGLPTKTTSAPGVMTYNPVEEWTGGGLVSNSLDLANWAKALYEGHAMAGPYLDALLRATPRKGGDPAHGYGLGVFVDATPLGTTYGHGGWIPGYASDMIYYKDYRVAIAVQINTDGGIVDNPKASAAIRERLSKVVLDWVRRE